MLYIIKIVMHTGEDGATYDVKAVLSVMMRLCQEMNSRSSQCHQYNDLVPGTLQVDVPESTLKVL